jgi:hypothetical protein
VSDVEWLDGSDESYVSVGYTKPGYYYWDVYGYCVGPYKKAKQAEAAGRRHIKELEKETV